MHTVYKTVSPEDIDRILDYCRNHSVDKGGLFEVYAGSGGGLEMVIINSCGNDGPTGTMRPLGAFYCNYSGPGVISIEEEDPYFDGMDSAKRHVVAVKQVIDILLREGYPGTRIRFHDLSALQF